MNLGKWAQDGSGSTESITGVVTITSGYLDVDTYYTLTLAMNGTMLTGHFSGGGFDKTVSGTDSSLANGKPGLALWGSNSSFKVKFDNFLVRVP